MVLYDFDPRDEVPVGHWCTNPTPSLRVPASLTPRVAGLKSFNFLLSDNTGHIGSYYVSASVYAARRAAVSAPTLPYGARGKAKVVVQDAHRLNTWSAAPRGVTVYLQRRAAGTTRWITLGSAKTVAGGIASIPFTSTANGAFRAVLASSVPHETVISPSIGVKVT
ncbi:hypothetical protein [Kribbella sp. NPDC023855]|uniref:hypothetical protein n=1 Tax=Kribbella sp. NPDC023855 TaxID=3154698 RepID=UPI0033E9D623